MENFRQDSRTPDRGMNLGLSKYELVLTTSTHKNRSDVSLILDENENSLF